MPKVRKKYLLLIAGLFWCFAGFMVIKIGFPLVPKSDFMLLTILGAIIIMLIFYLLIFSSLVYKHEKRVRNYPQEKLPFWYFFDLKSYILIAIMMGGGIALRKFELIPHWFIAFFYSGLGVALFSCGVRFLVRFAEYEKGLHLIQRHENRLNKKK